MKKALMKSLPSSSLPNIVHNLSSVVADTTEYLKGTVNMLYQGQCGIEYDTGVLR
jgi:hypothetical protein